jgi:hypothetical protein
MTVQTVIKHRRDTAANWTAANPTLAAGEIGVEIDTLKFKIGDGGTAWTVLAYQNTQGPQGIQGLQGLQGNAGYVGSDGAQGLQGRQGTQGVQGTQGIQVQGTQGIQGNIGTQGIVASSTAPTNTSILWVDTSQTSLTSVSGGTVTRDTNIQLRRDTAANWTSSNPTLAVGETGFETDTGYSKTGNGSTAWTSLQYGNFQQFKRGYISQAWYYGGFAGSGGTNSAITQNTLHAIPFYVGNTTTFDRIGINGVGGAAGTVRLGIYLDNNGLPGTLLADYGTVSMGGSGFLSITISPTLSGIVWLAAVSQGAGCTTSTVGFMYNPFIGNTDSPYASGASGTGYYQTGVSGSLPSTWGSTFNILRAGTITPAIYMRTV